MPKTVRRAKPEAEAGEPEAGPVLLPLSELAAGRVVRLNRRELSEGEACLLAAMGLTLGSRLVVRSNGDPCIVEVRSTRIGLARSVACRLLVCDDDSAPAEPAR
jgi:Fe2+ transport system protein FeoA